jgi:hypothetical protein
MPVDVSKTLRQALSKLTVEKRRMDRQIDAIQMVLRATDGRGSGRARGPAPNGRRRGAPRAMRKKRMSAAARKAVSARMKAYWAKRKGAGKAKATKRAASKEEK